jgi:catechol 2,3-dioxygenase
MNFAEPFSPVAGVKAVRLGVSSLDRSVAFYRDVWGLEVLERSARGVALAATGSADPVLLLETTDAPGFLGAILAARDPAAVDAAHDALARAGVTPATPRADERAGGYGFSFADAEGRPLALEVRSAPIPPLPNDDRPRKITHVVFNAADADASEAWLARGLRFRVSDRSKMMTFMRCARDHHTIAYARFGHPSFNHVAFEMADWNGLMYACGRLKERGHPVLWGIGRHGPGDNVFAYFLDPDGFAIEYTAEVQQIDESTHRVGTPADWERPPSRMDAWGLAPPPAAPLAAAMHDGRYAGGQPAG